jgi:hypothetical protein
MPGLRIGQEWTVPVYSPLRFSDSRNPVEILHAKVEDRESVVIGEEPVLTSVVVYRSDSGAILGGAQTPRGKLWVADDGTVLKQSTRLFGSQLTFLRAEPKRVEQILAEAETVQKRMGSRSRRLRQSGAPSESAKKDAREAAQDKADPPADKNAAEKNAADNLAPQPPPKAGERNSEGRGE